MKVFWFCNCPLSDSDATGTGTWLGAMAHALLGSKDVELGIIAPGPVRQFTRSDYRQVKQWLIPAGTSIGSDGLPPASLVQAILAAVNEFSPDLVHIWGTETFYGLLSARGLLTYPSLLLLQGLSGQIAKVFYGGLTLSEQLRCVGIKELLKRRTMYADRRDFARRGLREEEMIRGHRFIDAQSSWGAAQVRAINPEARLFSVDLVLRQPFYDANAWQPPSQPAIFCTAAYTAPFKGLHVAVRALALLRKRISDARLRIAGAHQRAGIRQDGYIRWVNRMIHQLDLVSAVDWLGPLNAENIVMELQNAAAVVIPTFIETYCVAFAEAMQIGAPAVVAYAGGTPSLGKDDNSCLFFQPGDTVMCAHQLERVLTNKALALQLSRESRKIAAVRNDRQKIVQRQLEIYRQILQKN
ncbi:MAG: glycosyltransferase [Kiritimatiellae bacterium]|nr:glycosyltransferase [Kiritimatiellia bacterium]